MARTIWSLIPGWMNVREWYAEWQRMGRLKDAAYDSWDAAPGRTAAEFREKILSIAYQLGNDVDARWNPARNGAEIFNLRSEKAIAFVRWDASSNGKYDVTANFPLRLPAWDEQIFQKGFGEGVCVTILFDKDTT